MTLRTAAIHVAALVVILGGWSSASLAETVAAARPAMLVYGNYCGLGNNAPLQPIDALDAACAPHDECTPDDGLPTKACNLRLQQEAEAVAADLRQPDNARKMAGLVAAFAANHQFKAAPEVVPADSRVRKPRRTYASLR